MLKEGRLAGFTFVFALALMLFAFVFSNQSFDNSVDNSVGDSNSDLLTGNAVHSLYSGFALPSSGFNYVSNVVLESSNEQKTITFSARDDVIYKTAYVSLNGKPWMPISLTGNMYQNSNVWIGGSATGTINVNSASFNLSSSKLLSSRNYVIFYSCSRTNSWDCHSNLWQIRQFNVSLLSDICPLYTPPSPDWCVNGIRSSGKIDENGCQGPPICTAKNSSLQTGLISWWKLDGDVQDSVGASHGLRNGPTSTTTGCVSGSCYLFNGVNNYLDIPLNSVFSNIPSNNFTVSFWMNPNDVSGDGNTWKRVMESRYDNNNFMQVVIGSNDGEMMFIVEDAGTQRTIKVNQPITAGKMYHVVGTWSSNNIVKLYLNGAEQILNGDPVADAGSQQRTNIGRRTDGVAESYYSGTIDDVRIWNRYLSNNEVQELFSSYNYTAPVCTPESRTTTCSGKCGAQLNNCGQNINCGTCSNTGSMVVLYYNNFEQNTIGSDSYKSDWTRCYPNIDSSIYRDAADANPTKVFRHHFPKGSWSINSEDGASCSHVTKYPRDEAYLTYRVKFGPGFNPVKGGKVADLYADTPVSIAGRCPDGTDGYDALVMFHSNSGKVGQRFYVYYPDQWTNQWYMDAYHSETGKYPTGCQEVIDVMGGCYGSSFSWSVPFDTEKWYTITIRLVANTPGQKNGLVEAFVDGKMVSQVTGLRFRDISSLKINTAEINTFFGGGDASFATTKDEYIYYDDVMMYYYTYSSDQPIGNTPRSSGSTLPAMVYPSSSIINGVPVTIN